MLELMYHLELTPKSYELTRYLSNSSKGRLDIWGDRDRKKWRRREEKCMNE
jgi:hypothetical protein